MMKKLLLLSLMCILVSFSQAFAQNRTVTGKVISAEDNSPLPGVNVTVKGTSNGTSTGVEGTYSLSVPDGATLVFSFVGYTPQEIIVGNQSVINVTLAGDVRVLTDVVVVGYGTTEKQDLTGNIAKVSGATIQNMPVTSFEQAIQGRAAGVYVNSGSGKLGQGIQVRVRGAASISASNQPLYVIDGIPITSTDIGNANTEPINPLADISPTDIESIEILKDASAAAIYGSRASNGVVLVTTKKGKAGNTKIELGVFTGFSHPTRKREWLNATEYKQLFDDAIKNSATVADFGYDANNPTDLAAVYSDFGGIDRNSTSDVKWSDEAFQKGTATQYNLSLSGGNEKTRFFVSGSYSDQKGIIVGNKFQRANARINLDHSVNKKIKVGTNIGLFNNKNFRVPDDNAFSNPLQLVALPPLQPKIDPNTGLLNRNTLYYNNLIELENASNLSTTYRTISSIYGSWEIIKGLTFRSEYGLDFYNIQEEIYRGRRTEDGGPTGYGYNSQSTAFNYTINNTFNYVKNIGDMHSFDVVAGTSFQESRTRDVSAEGRGFPNDRFTKIASAARKLGGTSTTGTGYAILSYLARVNYKFNNKYLVSLSGRYDGASRFGADKRYGFFPAGSIGWILSEESFMKNISSLSFLKLRASYGTTGNAEIGNFASRGLWQAVPYADQAGIVPVSIENKSLSWEQTKQFDLGLEFGFLNNRFSGELDYYLKKTDGLLLNIPVPATNGYTTIPENIGSLENKGVEVVLNTQNLVGTFKWSTNFNIAFNRNKVTKLNVSPIASGGRNIGRIAEGEPAGYFYTKKYAGVDPNNGDALYYQADGSPSNDYVSAPEQKVGNPNPDFIGGMTNNLSFMGFDLSFLLQFSYGNDIYNTAGFFQSVNGDYFDNQSRDQLAYWKKPGDVTKIPQPRFLDGNGSGVSSRWVQDGSFLRIKTVTFGYNFPKSLLSRAKIQSARIYVQGLNLHTFTKYEGYDPEVSTNVSSNLNLGHDFYTPPLPRTFTIGINVGL